MKASENKLGFMRKKILLSGILWICAILISDMTHASFRISKVPKYGVFELTLNVAGNYANPYLLMPGDNTTPGFLVGKFMSPDGNTITMDGFWDNGKTWKIRMSPTATGTWRYVTSSKDPGLDEKKGSFICTPSDSKGFIQVDSRHPHHFMWDDGTPFYWSPVAIMISHFDTRDAQGGNRRIDNGAFKALTEIRQKQGFNATHWGYTALNKPQFNDKTQMNEGGAPFIDYNPDRLNPVYHQFGDRRVEALIDSGVIPQFQIGWPDQDILTCAKHAHLKRYWRYLKLKLGWSNQDISPCMDDTSLKRYWRYLIARYAAYNITFNLFGEVEEFGSDYLAIANDYGSLTRRWDPYDHLITTHTVGTPSADLLSQPWMDYIMLQRPASDTSNYLSFGKPVVNSEYLGYEDFQVKGEELRPLMWDVRMRGGYFVYESWGNDPQSTGARYAKLVNFFFRDHSQFWLLEFHPELFGGKPGLADPGKEYVIYLPSGGSITVDLESVVGSLPVKWYNPRSGTISSQTEITGAGNRTFKPPDTNDWVLHIGGKS